MKNYKILVDRKPLDENYIHSKEDFGKVLEGARVMKPPVWKSAWFYGPVGMATVALSISVSTIYAKETQKPPNNLPRLTVSEKPLEEIKNREVKTKVIEISIQPRQETKSKDQKLNKEGRSKKDEIKVIEISPLTEELINEPKNKIIENKATLNTVRKSFPNINNVYTGDITFSNLCSENGITCGENSITSFTIQYFNGSEDVNEIVQGNRIPEKSCELIEKYNNGTMIYLTNIRGVDENGKNISFPSINYVPRY